MDTQRIRISYVNVTESLQFDWVAPATAALSEFAKQYYEEWRQTEMISDGDFAKRYFDPAGEEAMPARLACTRRRVPQFDDKHQFTAAW